VRRGVKLEEERSQEGRGGGVCERGRREERMIFTQKYKFFTNEKH
jgi:hypothetical protein